MELLFVVVIAASLGIGVQLAVPGSASYGSSLVPAVSAAVASVFWVALLWIGWTFDGGWIWLVSLASGVIASAIVAFLLPRRRAASDARLLEELTSGVRP